LTKRRLETNTPPNMAIPPNVGVAYLCEVRPLGKTNRFLATETLTITGIAKYAIRNEQKNAEPSFIQSLKTGRKNS
jgi:hypothetical protein